MDKTIIDGKNIKGEDFFKIYSSLLNGLWIPANAEKVKDFNKRVAKAMDSAKNGLNLFFTHSGVIFEI